jgi:hypothetical protein
VVSFAPYGGGYLVVGSDLVLHQIESTGRLVGRSCASGYPVISADNHLTAWATRPTCGARNTTIHEAPTNGSSNAEETQWVPGRVDVVGLLHGAAIISAAPLSHPGAWVLQLSPCRVHGGCGPRTAPRAIPGLASAGGVDQTDALVTGQSANSHGRSGVLVDAATGAPRWTRPGWHLGRFSPDGTYVAGWRFEDHGEVTRLGILDRRTGRPVRTVDNLVDEAFADPLAATAWENNHNLLVIAQGTDGRAMVRIPISGPLNRATPVVQIARPGDAVYAFSARP